MTVSTACTAAGGIQPQPSNSPTPVPTPSSPPGLVQQAHSPTWAPDGQRFVFLYRTRAQGTQEVKDEVYSALLDGSDVIRVTQLNPARFKSVRFDPTGQQLLYSREDTEEIYTSAPNGENFQKVADGDNPSWDSTGSKFVCTYDNTCETVDRVGGRQCQRQIRLYDTISQTFVALPVTLPREVIAPAFSADGQRIQWLSTSTVANKELSQRQLEFHTFTIGTQHHQTTQMNQTDLAFGNAEWSKDRTLLAFNYLSRIQLLFFNNLNTFALTEGIQPNLSSDGSRILYTDTKGESYSDIALFDRRDNSIRTVISHRSLPVN